jgi:hypothetical protein
MALSVVRDAAASGVPVGEWSHAECVGAARVLSRLLVERRAYRGEQSYLAASRLLVEVTIRLEETAAAPLPGEVVPVGSRGR